MNPKLTIGMPTYDDFHGCWATIMSLRLFHSDILKDTELIVVDNNPGQKDARGLSVNAHSREVMNLVAWSDGKNGAQSSGSRFASASYIEQYSPVGSAAAKNRVFQEAKGEVVLCIDSHIMIPSGALKKLLDYFENHPTSMDLMTGPLLRDDLSVYGTHFNDVWSSNMRGQWASDPRGLDPEGEPFEIQAMGCGVMCCRKEAWVGFNPDLAGFGAEEWYIHEKFRQHGRKVICLPFLQWLHRFGCPEGKKYPLFQVNTVRNFLIGFQELGQEEEIARCRRHFVDGVQEANELGVLQPPCTSRIPADLFDAIAANPAAAKVMMSPQQRKNMMAGVAGSLPSASVSRSIDESNNTLCVEEHDLKAHMSKLRELASQCQHVTELGGRVNASTAILAGKPKQVVAIASNNSFEAEMSNLKVEETQLKILAQDSASDDIEETDMLFIGEAKTAAQLHEQLTRYTGKVRHWIVLHNTVTFGVWGEGHQTDKPVIGLMHSLRRWLKQNPEWSVVDQSSESGGLMVLSCKKEDKPALPNIITKGKNFFGAVATHISNGHPIASQELIDARKDICMLCEYRNPSKKPGMIGGCAKCGCNMDLKVTWADMECGDKDNPRWSAMAEKIPK